VLGRQLVRETNSLEELREAMALKDPAALDDAIRVALRLGLGGAAETRLAMRVLKIMYRKREVLGKCGLEYCVC
jgi:hypothetical protein